MLPMIRLQVYCCWRGSGGALGQYGQGNAALGGQVGSPTIWRLAATVQQRLGKWLHESQCISGYHRAGRVLGGAPGGVIGGADGTGRFEEVSMRGVCGWRRCRLWCWSRWRVGCCWGAWRDYSWACSGGFRFGGSGERAGIIFTAMRRVKSSRCGGIRNRRGPWLHHTQERWAWKDLLEWPFEFLKFLGGGRRRIVRRDTLIPHLDSPRLTTHSKFTEIHRDTVNLTRASLRRRHTSA